VLASSRKKFEQLKKEKERELSKVESDIQKAADAVKKTIEERKKVDPKPRIDPTRPHEDIDTQIKEIEKVISEQSNTTDKVSLFEKYAEKSKRLFAAKNEYKQIEKVNKQIAKMMAKRKSRTRYIISYTQYVMNLSFAVVLNHNGFTGSLDFSKPQSLILEDSNNRHLSINLLLREAGRMESTQFIFLSPLDLPDLRVANNISIKVHKMQAPQRIGLSTMDEQ
ncbi:A-kinase anchor protein 9, partial [Parasteatoda tepidariorum]|uniref:A-kinase anchor protein 9 n=1 Tax=Parasteatoda tepidariorum TaxID=114398 RepID=UPI001C724880